MKKFEPEEGEEVRERTRAILGEYCERVFRYVTLADVFGIGATCVHEDLIVAILRAHDTYQMAFRDITPSTCSKCGVTVKWARSDYGLIRTCPYCGYREHA